MTATQTRRRRGPEGVFADVVAFVKAADRWVDRAEIADAVGAHRTTVSRHLAIAVKSGELQARGSRAARRYAGPNVPAAAPRPGGRAPLRGARAEIKTAIESTPGLHTETSLTAVLGLDRDEVALICGALLCDELIRLAKNGTYWPAPGGRA